MERQIADALRFAGDQGGAFLWRRICRDLSGGLRVGVASLHTQLSERAIEQLKTQVTAEWVALTIEAGEAASLGAIDRAMGVHVLLWATPAHAPLGGEERAAIEALTLAGAPNRAAVLLAEMHVLKRMSDDPEAETKEIKQRAQDLLGDAWQVLLPDEAMAWLLQARKDLPDLVIQRRGDVSRLLLVEARRSADSTLAAATEEVERIQALIRQEDADLDEVRRKGKRAAVHLLSAMKRQTERLIIDLAEFLTHLESVIPDEVASVPDLDQVQRALPHWLQHVTERWLGDRLGQWRLDVAQELEALPLTSDDLVRAELLTPGLHPAPLARERDWTTRLGATAALGGGAALLLMGLWAPGLLAVGGGLGWSQLRHAAREGRSRTALTESAIVAVRQLGAEATSVLQDQVDHAQESVADLGEERAAALEVERASTRDELDRLLLRAEDRRTELGQLSDGLNQRIANIQYLLVEGA
jgi:hypothetical protein